ncbi:MAG TPA: G1 family glutamic endopeptidase [Gaiellaceae bacterium]|jgi:hypothetical protein|nr:G1 family glutamic endopeptidase [Gaiellaceae bacterium]
MQVRAALGAIALASALSAAAVAAAPPANESDNWSGYAATGASFKSVRASWVQPVAQCFGRSAGQTSSSFWVGLGGDLRRSYKIEQIGTSADCYADGSVDDFAWFELWPAGNVPLELRVLPGDRIAAAVTLGRASVHFSLVDATRHEYFSRTLAIHAPDGSSAEWIAEGPARVVHGHHEVESMTDFGSIRFTNASATSNRGAGSISSRKWRAQKIDFRSDGVDPGSGFSGLLETADAAHGFPSRLSRGGASFEVVWRRGLAGGKSAPPGSA